LTDVLKEFYVDKAVQDALFDQSGFLGELYSIALAVETFDTNLIDNFLENNKIDKGAFENMILEVFKNTVEMEKGPDQE
jgi:hypothetical protein